MNTTNRFSQEYLTASEESSDMLGYDIKQKHTKKTQTKKTQTKKTQTDKTQTDKTQTNKTQTNKTQTNKTQTDKTDNNQHSAHPHIHSEESLRRIINRLSRIEGHVRGIKTMVQQSSSCPDVLLQIAAVRGALDKVARIVLDEHLSECIARAVDEGNIDVEIKELKAALDRFLP